MHDCNSIDSSYARQLPLCIHLPRRSKYAKKGESLVVLIESAQNLVWQHLLPARNSIGLLAAQHMQRMYARRGWYCLYCTSAAYVLCHSLLTCSATPPEPGTASKLELPFAEQLHSCSAATAAICLIPCQRIASVHCAQSCRLQQVKCRSSHVRQSWKHSAWLHPVLAWKEALPLPTAWLQVTLLQLVFSPATAKA